MTNGEVGWQDISLSIQLDIGGILFIHKFEFLIMNCDPEFIFGTHLLELGCMAQY